MVPYTFMRWTCLALMLLVGPLNPFIAFGFLCGWAAIGTYQVKNGLL